MQHRESKSCIDPETGEPLREFSSMKEALTEASMRNKLAGEEIATASKCGLCDAFHVTLASGACEFERVIDVNFGVSLASYTARLGRQTCNCRGRDGQPKRLYPTAQEAREVADSRDVPLRIYECPETCGYHLTSSGAGFY